MNHRIRLAAAPMLLALLLALGVSTAARAQGSTPATDTPITVQALASGMPSDSPGKAILLLRITIQPGAGFPDHIHPGALVIAVESGDFAFTLVQGEADLTRGAATGSPAATEQLTAGQDVVAKAGDAIFEQAGVLHSARNAGDTSVVVLVAGLVDPTQDFLQPMEMGTPAP